MRGCYTTYRPISIVTRASVMQIETRVERGLLARCSASQFFWTESKKTGNVARWQASSWSISTIFCDLIRRDNCCCLDLSFGYSLIRKDRFIKNLFPFLFSDFEIENCDWNLREKVSVLCSRFKRYCKTFIHISPRLFFIWNVNRINVIKVTFFLKDTRKSIKYAGPLSTLRTEFKNWYLNVTKIVVEGKKRYLLVDVVQFNRRQRQHFDCWVNGQRGKERGKMEWNAYENIGPFRSIDGPMVENGTNRLI